MIKFIPSGAEEVCGNQGKLFPTVPALSTRVLSCCNRQEYSVVAIILCGSLRFPLLFNEASFSKQNTKDIPGENDKKQPADGAVVLHLMLRPLNKKLGAGNLQFLQNIIVFGDMYFYDFKSQEIM